MRSPQTGMYDLYPASRSARTIFSGSSSKATQRHGPPKCPSSWWWSGTNIPAGIVFFAASMKSSPMAQCPKKMSGFPCGFRWSARLQSPEWKIEKAPGPSPHTTS